MSVMRAVDPALIDTPTPRSPRSALPVGRVVLTSVVYLVVFGALYAISAVTDPAHGVGPGFFEPNHGISPWFLPQGATLALLVICGVAYAPLVALANIAGGILLHQFSASVPAVIAISLVTTIGYSLVAHILRAGIRLNPHLLRLRDVINITLVAFLLPLAVGAASAACLVCCHVLPGWQDYFSVVVAWWSGDIVGLLAVAPFCLVFGAPWAQTRETACDDPFSSMAVEQCTSLRFSWTGLLQMLVWGAAIAATLWGITYLQVYEVDGAHLHLSYLAILLIVWLALQHGIRGATAGIVSIALGLEFATLNMLHLNIADQLVDPQIFTITLSITGLLLGAVVSEQRISEAAVRSSEDLLRTLIDAMPDLVTFKDGLGRWITSNEFGRRLFQLEQQPFRGKTDVELAAAQPSTRDAFLRYAQTDVECWNRGEAMRGEDSIPRPDGTSMTFDVIKVPLFREDGGRKGLVVIGRDITERKLAEEALSQERAYLSAAIDVLPLPLAFLSTTGDWTLTNAACETFAHGLTPRQWLDAPMLTPDTRTLIPNEERPVTRALNYKALISTEVILSLPHEREMPLLVHAGPIYVNGKMVAVVAAFQDITAIKAADQAKDEFLGILSHELITPLNDTLGWTQAAREMPDSTPQALDIIEANARLLQRVMTDLLDLSRIIHGKMFLRKEPVDLWKQIELAAREYEPMARGRRRIVSLEPPDEPLPISADTERLQQVFSTLLANALKGTDAGDSIIISCVREGAMGVLVIRDTGRGIPPDELPHLFTPFHQAQSLEQGRAMGLGLGMAIIKGIVELHGGYITADSQGNGQGSAFTIELPLSRVMDA